MVESITSKGEQTRAALIEAAFGLFSQQGFHGTTMRQIAEQVDLTPGSIYNHFSGKDEIFLAVVETYHPLNTIGAFLAEAKGESVAQLVRLAAGHFAQAMDDHPGLLNLALVELVELNGQHMPALVESLRPQVMTFVRRLAEADGQLRPISAFSAFRSLLGALFAYELTGQMLQAALGPEADSLGSLDDFVDIYLYGILQPPVGSQTRWEE
jgi:AcrR family transcriptional regulator